MRPTSKAALLGHGKVAKRGTGKFARVSAAKAHTAAGDAREA
jgi:hypothetical protein